MMEVTKTHRVAGGTLRYGRHPSAATGTSMALSVFTPDGPGPFPALVWLSGLTCTEDNFTTKGGAYAAAAREGLVIVAPDTSPRGEGVPDDPAWDLGQGASFYVDATEAPWAGAFQMERHVTEDVFALLRTLPVQVDRVGISGHSMGGHGALTLALRHPQLFRSVSAFSPIVSPARCPWGEKAFGAYLGPDRTRWAEHDATLLIASGAARGAFDDILVDQGLADPFLAEQLKPELLGAACATVSQPLTLRRHEGYDHSYFFVSTFLPDHVAWHAERLRR